MTRDADWDAPAAKDFLDRSAVGNANVAGLSKDLHLSTSKYQCQYVSWQCFNRHRVFQGKLTRVLWQTTSGQSRRHFPSRTVLTPVCLKFDVILHHLHHYVSFLLGVALNHASTWLGACLSREPASNLMVKKVGARWISFLTVCFGVVTIS